MKLDSRRPYIQKLIILDRSRGIERCRALKVQQIQLSRGFQSKEARWIEVAIEHPEGFSMDQSSYRECNKKQMKGLDGQPSYQEVSRQLLRLLKNVFQGREKHRYECNQTCYLIKDPNNILNSQKHLSTKKCQAQRSKTHIHTKQV